MSEVIVSPTPAGLAHNVAAFIVEEAAAAIAARGRFILSLAGGSTPKAAYERLATAEFASHIAWSRVHLVWGDERCVPPDHPESNYAMVRDALLDHVDIPPENIHRIRTEDGPEEAAQAYERELRRLLGPDAGLDCALLGLGRDGHTASLFPNSAALDETTRWVMPQYVDAIRAMRVTLTLPALNTAGAVGFIVSGADKRDIVRIMLSARGDSQLLPAQMVAPVSGRLFWFLDADAAPLSITPS